MLYVLGGAARSGKTLLARRAVSEKGIPYFPLDALFGILVNGMPELGIRYDDPILERPVKMWPYAKHFFDFFFKEENKFLIEGDTILPSQVNEFIIADKPIRACFLGYPALTGDEKLSLVRQYHQGEKDWTKGFTDEKLLPIVEEMVTCSKYLQDECSKYGIKYFDISHDFEGVRSQAFEYLFAE